MMICNDETIGGNERTTPAGIETYARFLQMLEPLRCRLELIFFLQLFERRKIEKPHAFIGVNGRNKAKREAAEAD